MTRVTIIVAILLAASAGAADRMFYLMTGPPGGVRLQPYTATLYTVDTVSGKLVEVWDFGARHEFPRVRMYPTEQLATIEVGYAGEGECFWMWWDSLGLLHSAEEIEPAIGFFGSLVETSTGPQLQALVMRPDGPPRMKLLDLFSQTVEASAGPIPLADVRLAGTEPGPGFAGNVLQADIDGAGNLQLRDSLITHDLPAIPDSIIVYKNSYGWIIIANEADYLVVMSVPNQKGETHKQLLIFSRSNRTWRSLLIPGSHTLPRLFSDRLAGVIADENPDVNYETRATGPPVEREEAVVINPLQVSFFEVSVGEDASVLWVDSTDIYYKRGLTIYRARIEGDTISESTAIVTDQPVFGIKWAFPGIVVERN